jgi:hypothetical protein
MEKSEMPEKPSAEEILKHFTDEDMRIAYAIGKGLHEEIIDDFDREVQKELEALERRQEERTRQGKKD